MTEIQFVSDMGVELVNWMANDMSVVRSARVSTGADLVSTERVPAGLIRFLMNNRHGTPFEHNSMMFRIHAPIFVMREFQRHRIGFSYNEESGRYRELEPAFYIPAADRPLVQVGKPGAYEFIAGDEELHAQTCVAMRSACSRSFREYQVMLDEGVAREVARMVLPVSLFSSMYVTCNARSLMSFLSLRTRHKSASVPSFPQREIELVAEKMEALWAELMPVTYAAFNEAGRVSP